MEPAKGKVVKKPARKKKISTVGVDFSPLERCVILCVDPARVSGWSFIFGHDGGSSGECDIFSSPNEPFNVCTQALEEAARRRAPCLLLVERPFRGSVQGSELGTWRNAWLRAGGKPKMVQGVYPSQWRSVALGSKWVRASRDLVKAHEMAEAKKMAHGFDVGPDESAARCMTRYALRSVGLLKRLPKRFVAGKS